MKLFSAHSLKWLCVSAIFLNLDSLEAQTLGIYEFSGTGACPHANTAVTAQPAHAAFSAFASVGTTCTSSNDVFNNKAWNTGANVDVSEYNELTLVAEACHKLSIVSLSFDHKLSTGTATWHLRTNMDHFAADVMTGASSATQATSVVSFTGQFASIDTLTVRFYITGIAAGTTTWRQDNVSISGAVNAISPVAYYIDNDGDGFGTGAAVLLCSNPGGYALNDGDCNDNHAAIHPETTWYADHDGDGFGDPATAETGCSSALANATLHGGDCNDEDHQIHPQTAWYEDADQDGFGDPDHMETTCASTFMNAVLVAGDCNDGEPSVYPGAPEICDAFDNNCNGQVNEGLAVSAYYVDADGDGFGTGNALSLCENPGSGYATIGGDCNDAIAAIHPGAEEIAGNGIDENCDLTDGYLGINVLNPAVLQLFPNPGNEVVTIRFQQGFDGKVTLYTVSGMEAGTFGTEGKAEIQVDTKLLAPGIYFVAVGSERMRWVKME